MDWTGLMVVRRSFLTRRAALAGAAGSFIAAAHAQTGATLQAFSSSATGLNGLVYRPATPPPPTGWPVVLWLHGFSLRGEDPWRLTEYGLPAVIAGLASARCLMIAPQLPRNRLRHEPATLDALLAELAAQLGGSEGPIIVMGASLGVANAWEYAAARPGRVAAALMLAGGGSSSVVRRAAVPRVRLVHGSDDRVVRLSTARRVEAVLREAGAEVELEVVSGAGHEAGPLAQAAFLNRDGLGWSLEAAGLQAPSMLVLPDASRLLGWMRDACQWPHRRPGTQEGHAAEAWLEGELRAIRGLEVGREDVDLEVWEEGAAHLTLGGAPVSVFGVPFSGATPPAGLVAPLVYAATGSQSDFARIDARGKIAVVDAEAAQGEDTPGRIALNYPRNMLGALAPGYVETGENPTLVERALRRIDAQRQAHEAGALGLIVLIDRTQIPSERFYLPYDGVPKATPAVYAARQSAASLREAARAGETVTLVQTGFARPGRMANLWARLTGPADRAIIVQTHHDSPWTGVAEDASGIAQVLGQAWAWSRVPAERRPAELWFLIAGGHFVAAKGAFAFAERRPELMRRTIGVVGVEHVAGLEARLSAGRLIATGGPQASHVWVGAGASRRVAERAFALSPQPFVEIAASPFGVPLSDAAGLVMAARAQGLRLPHVSWIAAPLYLLDPADTFDWLDVSRLEPAARTVAAMIEAFGRP